MTQPFLYLRHQSTPDSTAAVFKEIDMQVVKIGSDFASDEPTLTTVACNRVIHWENDLYAMVNSQIWKYDVANSGDWGLFYSFASPHANDIGVGLTPCSIDGSGVLVCAYGGPATNQLRIVKIDKDGNVSEDSPFVPSTVNWGAGSYNYSPVSHRNTLVWMAVSNNSNYKMQTYDLKAQSVVQSDFPASWSSQPPGSDLNQLCIAQDNIYMAISPYQAPPILVKRVGSSLIDQGNLDSNILHTGFTNPYWGQSLCEVDGKLFAFLADENGGGFEAIEIHLDSNGDMTTSYDVSSIILPASLSSYATNSTTSSMIRVDNISNSGLDPVYELLVYANHTEGGTVDLYRWSNAPSGQLVLVGAGLDAVKFNRINSNDGTGGERIWSGSGVINASQPDLSINSSDIDAEFTIFGAGQTGVFLEIFYDKEGEVCETRGTIASTSHGTLVNNAVSGLAADGTTKVTVKWSAAADGIVSGDNPKVAARVFI